MKHSKFWKRVAEAFGTAIEESYIAQDDTDAGALFANKYNVQVSPYMPKPYILWHSDDDETFKQVGSFKTQKQLIKFIKTLKEKNEMKTETVKIGNLLPNVTFYRANPDETNVLPDYNVNLTDAPDTEVWIVYPEGGRDSYVKKGSWKVEIRAVGERSFVASGVRLPDREQAERYASELMSRWYGADEYRLAQSEDEPNYTADEYGRLTRIEK